MASKLVKIILVGILSLLCFTGCIRHEATVEFRLDGKADITMLYATVFEDKELAQEANDKTIEQLTELGWECKEYEQDNFLGYEITKKGVDVENLTHVFDGSEELTEMSAEGFTVTKDGNNYVVDWDLIDEETHEQMQQYAGMFEGSGGSLKITMKFPNKPKEHNATEVTDGGKTLTWNLFKMDPGETAHVEFTLSKMGLIIKLVCIIAAVILAVVVAIMVMKKLGKKKAQVEAAQTYENDNNDIQ